VGGGAEIFELLAGEDVNGDQMDLGVTVLSGLGGGHLDDLAGAVLDADETVLPQGRALHGVGGRGTRIGAVEGVLMLSLSKSVQGARRRRKRVRSWSAAGDSAPKGGVKSTCGAGMRGNVPARRCPPW
jgi:hypothetical protein